LSGTDRKFTVNANGSITVSSNIILTTSNVTGNENFKSAGIEFISNNWNFANVLIVPILIPSKTEWYWKRIYFNRNVWVF
jgi:hypothetical protein